MGNEFTQIEFLAMTLKASLTVAKLPPVPYIPQVFRPSVQLLSLMISGPAVLPHTQQELIADTRFWTKHWHSP